MYFAMQLQVAANN